MPAPPLSLRGAREALRWPTRQDLLFSIKGMLAVVLSLYVGFGQNLDNPYWAELTVYVLMSQPQSGAIRSKGLYRFYGTLAGGWAAIGLAALFGSSVGALLLALSVFMIGAHYMKMLDRTPVSYFWFATALTAGVVGLTYLQHPEQIFTIGIARMIEISLGILAIGFVDSLLAPRPETHAFLDAMRGWRDAAADWAADALSPEASDVPQSRLTRRKALRGIAEKTSVLDALGVQLPFDMINRPPRTDDLRLLRLTVGRLIAELTAANLWAEAVRAQGGYGANADLAEQARLWLTRKPLLGGPAALDHVAEGETLAARLTEVADSLIASGPRDAVLRGTALMCLQQLITSASVQDQVLHAMTTGDRLPQPLHRAARNARPARSLDYLVTALDILPLALCFAGCSLVWYLTAWSGGITPLLFVYIIGAIVLGGPGAVPSAAGGLVWIAAAFALSFLYEFAVLPQVTDFPVLIAVLAVALIPIGIFQAMSPGGLLVLANAFAFLGLQNVYAGDFELALQNLASSIAGCLMILAAVYVCAYDEPRLRARRLSQALSRDVAEAAGARRIANLDRYITLGVDRLSLFYKSAANLPAGDPLHGQNLIARFRIGVGVLALRRAEAALPPTTLALTRRLRHSIASNYRRGASTQRAGLLAEVEAAYDAVVVAAPPAGHHEALMALTGLRIALRPDDAFEALLRSAGA